MNSYEKHTVLPGRFASDLAAIGVTNALFLKNRKRENSFR
jgi:hypothetical protein